ncbi:hypothetical protein Q5762_20415 [Streptomyces sp. P9(2023)]|uniref:hypothetical protein n=1 Tax=Streptomyces sp. P9(2023) TaxID=3064394 RepID=UPI0028F44527|nr:hypothetical protein [Streptomyces sp. P9(2023)]MDT9690663.1 hypothetical protein [Streptomyces sp. P9(2023)]
MAGGRDVRGDSLLYLTPDELAVELLPALLLNLPFGVWADRQARSRRRSTIAADFGRAALLLTLPAVYLLDALTLGQLYAVAFGVGAMTVLFEECNATLFVVLVPTERYPTPSGPGSWAPSAPSTRSPRESSARSPDCVRSRVRRAVGASVAGGPDARTARVGRGSRTRGLSPSARQTRHAPSRISTRAASSFSVRQALTVVGVMRR